MVKAVLVKDGERVQAGGKVSVAARALGVHRTQLRRWLAHLEIDPVDPA